MKKISTVQIFGNEIFKEQKLTIGVDLVFCIVNTLTNSEKERMLRHAASRRTQLASFRVRA
jgi:hypothetical protein